MQAKRAKHYILIFGFQKILSGPCGNQEFLGGEHSEEEFVWSSQDTIFNRLTHANTLSCRCALQAQLQAMQVTHAMLRRAFGAPGGILEHPGD